MSFKNADLRTVQALVAGSPILAGPEPLAETLFSDWENQRKSADVDALILKWIASHVHGSAHRGRVH